MQNRTVTALKLTIMTCAALAIMQTAFMVIPVDAIRLYNMALRPIVYAALAVCVYVFMGIDERPVPNAHTANVVSIVSVALFGIIFLIASFMFGAGVNIMVVSPPIIVRNLWDIGLIVVLGEIIRYRLIKGAGLQERKGTFIVIALTLALAYSQMSGIRLFMHVDLDAWDFYFESIFRPLVISSAASYFAVRGNFFSVVTVSFVFTMAPYLVPVMPDISPFAFSLTVSGAAFVSAVICHFATNTKARALRIREKRAAKYAEKSVLNYAVTVLIISVLAAFFAGAFPIYPVVALTGSMSGTFGRGSLVFVERVPQGEAFIRVGEGEIIHFISRTGIPYIHRVIEFRHDADGERQYITMGDAAELADPYPVEQSDVLGIARASLPFFGYPYIFSRAVLRVFN